MSESPIPVGTRVIVVRAKFMPEMLGRVGVVVEPLGFNRNVRALVYGVEFPNIGVLHGGPGSIKPLPPEDDVTAFDRAGRDVELEVC